MNPKQWFAIIKTQVISVVSLIIGSSSNQAHWRILKLMIAPYPCLEGCGWMSFMTFATNILAA